MGFAVIMWLLSLSPAFAQVNLAKTICGGVGGSGCVPLSGQPQIGQPVNYLITLDNTGQPAGTFAIQEDIPANFTPADPVNFITCVDSLGNTVPSAVTLTMPLQIDIDLPAYDTASCFLDGYFTDPGAVAINTVSSVLNPGLDASETTVVTNSTSLPVDLSLAKTSSTQGPIDLSAGPQTVTYTITMTTNGDVYLDDYFSIYDQLGLFSGSVPIDAQLNPGSVSCSTTASGGAGLSCPVTNDFSGTVVVAPWQSFVSFGYGMSAPILLQAGDTVTLTYSVTYSTPQGQTCVTAFNSDGINNRAFLGLSDGNTSISDSNPANNDTINGGNNSISVNTGITNVDPNCISVPPVGSGVAPSPLVASKTFVNWQPGGNTSTVPWSQQYATYWVEVTNTSSTDTVSNIELTDVYSNLPHTPNHNVQLYSVGIQCPAGSICTITSPPPSNAPQGPVQPINSYFATAQMWTGIVDKLDPGETVGVKVALSLRKPTCDFAWDQQIKSVRNYIYAEHEYPAVDPFTGDPIVVPSIAQAYADANVAQTKKCDFDVKKTIVSQPNDEVTFGQPIVYGLTFENGVDSIQAGSLIDVLRIEQDFYALGLDVNYQWKCREFPSGSVVNFTPSNSGNGTVNYVQNPHQGLRVMEHPGFVSFAPYAKLECRVSVIVSPPDPSDPYCYSNGTPTLGNAAIIDGSLFYNGNLAWPPAPQGTTWDGVSSELPKCYHLVVNKEVNPLTTTPNFGPDLTYNISITNASGSPSPEGDINFPAGAAPWSGPVFVDTFQNGPSPTFPPVNAPVTPLALDPCDPNGTHPCDWIQPPSTAGSELGLSQLAAGTMLNYSYVMPHKFKPHQICNDIDGEMLIDGQTSDRWYAKNPITLKDDVCALIRTNLGIKKSLDIDPLINLLSPPQFIVDINCTPPTGFNAVPMSQTLTQAAPYSVQGGIIVGSTCMIVEQTPDESVLPSHCDWNPPQYPNGQTILADGSVEPHLLVVHNSTTCRYGDIEVRKTVTGNGTPPAGTLFDMSVNCAAPASQVYTMSVADGTYEEQTDIVDGSSCTVTETPPADFTDDQGRSCVWGAPTYSPSQTVVSNHQSVQTIEVTNSLNCQSQQDILITKQIDLGTSGLTLPLGLTFDLNVTCTEPSGFISVNQTVNMAAGASQIIPNVSMPTTCTVSEVPPNYQLPENCTWGDPTYVGGGTQNFTYNPAVVQQGMTVINTPTCATGSLLVRKTWNPGSQLSLNQSTPPAGVLYTMNINCVDGTSQTATLAMNQTQVMTGLPANTSCTITETLPPHPDSTENITCTFNSPNYSPSSTFTVPSGGTHNVTVVNSAQCTFTIDDVGGGGPFLLPREYIGVEKIVNVPGVAVVSGTYNATVACGTQINNVALTAGATPTNTNFNTLISGYSDSCTVTETPPPDSLLPAGCSWNPPTYSPSQTVMASALQSNAPVVTITNTATCAPVPGTLDIVKETVLPPGLNLTSAPTFQANVICFNLPFSVQGMTSANPTITEGLNASVVSGDNKICFVQEQPPTSPLPNGCEWLPPVYPAGQVAYLNSGQTETRTIENRVLCKEGSFRIEKSFHPESQPIGNSESFPIQVDCGSPMNSSSVHTVSAGSPVTIDGILGTECTVTELNPPNVPYCSWEPVIYEAGGVSSTNPARVETSLTVPVVNLINQLICNFPPPVLEITKTLIDNEPCFDPATNIFDCDFEVTISNTGAGPANGPFTVTDTLTGLLAYTPPTAADNGWNCTLPPITYPAPLAPLSCDSPAGLSIPPGGSTSFVIDTHGVTFWGPTENCAGILDQDGQYIESCVPLIGPQLEIEKVLLTPDCAQNPTTECLFEVTVSNVGAGDYSGLLFVEDITGAIGSSTQISTTITSGPTNGWQCFPQAPIAWPLHYCGINSVTLAAGGGSTSFQFGMPGQEFRATDIPENCASLLFYEPLQESCVPVPWTPDPWMNIDKSVVSCPTPSSCTFEITVSNASSTTTFNHPVSIDDAVSPAGGSYVSNTGNYTCSGSGVVTCDSNGNVTIPPLGSDSFQITLDLSGGLTPEENCATLTSTYQSVDPVSCVPIIFPPAPAFTIEKTQITPGNCHGGTVPGGPNPNFCTFEITVTNTSGAPYIGDIVFTDQAMMGTYAIPGSPVAWGPQPNWSCVLSNTAVACTQQNVTLNPGSSTTMQVTIDLSAVPAPYTENCATLVTPGPGVSCIPNGGPAPDGQFQVLKTYAAGSSLPSENVNFPISVECAWPTNLPAWALNYTTFGSPGAATGNTQNVPNGAVCTVTEQPITADPGPNCSWLAPVYLPSQSVTASAGQLSTVTVQNEISCIPLTNSQADFVITKTLAGPCTNAICDYVITVTNYGAPYIGPISIDDTFTQIGGTLPWHVGTNSSDGWACTPMGQGSSFNCNVASITLGTSDSTSFTMSFDLEPGQAYDNCASTINPLTEATISDCASVPGAPPPLLDITKTQITPGNCHGGTVPGGQNPNLCEFEITITNQGPVSYQGDVTFSDLVGWGFPNLYGPTPPTAFSPPPWNCVPVGNTTECTYPNANMAVGDSLTMTVTLDMISLTGAGPTENCAAVEMPVQNPPVEACIPIGLEPELTIEKIQTSPGDCYSAANGGQCEFQITIYNNGTVDYFGQLGVDDNVLLGGNVHSGSIATQPAAPWYCATQSSGDFYCETNGGMNVPAGGSVSFTVTVNLNHPVRADQNCATLSSPSISPLPSSCVPLTPIPPADFTITKTLAGPCTNAICDYVITVTNNGAPMSGPLHVDDDFTLVGGSTPYYISTNSTDGWDCTPQGPSTTFDCDTPQVSLGTGDSTSFTMSFDLEPGQAYDNCASTINPLTEATISDCASVPGAASQTQGQLDISKTLGSCNAQGGPCSFDVTFTNLGPDPFSGPITFNDLISAGGNYFPTTTVTSIAPSGWSCVPASGLGNDCSTTVPAGAPIPVGGTLITTLTVGALPNMFVMHGNNCATLTIPTQNPPPVDCVPVGHLPMSFLQVTKALASDSDPSAELTTVFPINVNCGSYNTSTDYAAGQTELLEVDTPSGPCTVTEATPPAPADPNCSWDAPVYTPSNSISIPQGGVGTVTVTNRLVCGALLDATMEVSKQYAADSDWVPPNSAIHQLDATCVNAAGAITHSASVPLDWTGYIGALPGGSTCTFTEIPDASILPAGCTWEPPVFSNGGTAAVSVNGYEVFYIENKAVCQSLNNSNLSIEKTFLNGTCINSPSGQCEFLIQITNNSSSLFSGDINLSDLVSAGGYGNGGGIGATMTSYSSTSPWVCAQAGQGVDCDVSPITLASGGTTEITMIMDIPPGSPNIQNCVQIDQPIQNPLPQSCVQNLQPQSIIAPVVPPTSSSHLWPLLIFGGGSAIIIDGLDDDDVPMSP